MNYHYLIFLIPICLIAVVLHSMRRVREERPLDRLTPFEDEGSYAEDED